MKLLDIGNTVERAVANASELGVNMLTVHGHDLKTLRAAVSGRGSTSLKLLAVTVMTNLTADDLKQQGSNLSPADLVLHRARLAYESGFDGVIASGQEAANIRAATGPGFLIVTPGIRLPGSSTDDQERVMTPDHAIAAGADHIVVGRPITQADDPKTAAEILPAPHPRNSARTRIPPHPLTTITDERSDHMPKGYVIAHAVVTDAEKWGQYVAKSKVALDKFEGKPIVRGGKCEIVEGSNGTQRNVVLEFPSYEHALGYAKSPEYAEAKALRQGAGTIDITIVEGV